MNTIHNHSDSESHSDSDSRSQSGSQSSTVSAARRVVSCPICQKELQSRYLFNHIHVKHPVEFLDYLSTASTQTLQEYIDTKSPISLDYTVKNDFDEDEIKQIWGCLHCYATFASQDGGFKHCNDKKCKVKHTSQIRKLIKSFHKEKEEAKKQAKKQKARYTSADQLRDIEFSRHRELYFKRMVDEVIEYLRSKGEDVDTVLQRTIERAQIVKSLTYYETLLREMNNGILYWHSKYDGKFKWREYTVRSDGSIATGSGLISPQEHCYYVYDLKRLPDEYLC